MATKTYANGIELNIPDEQENLYGILGVGRGESNHEKLKEAWKSSNQSSSARFAYKALSDPSYKAVYDATNSIEAVFDAGFFDDGLYMLTSDYPAWNVDFETTPTHKVLTNLRKGVDRPLVLVTTGGFSPIHKGHVAMMEEAKRIAEENGFTVVGGYFAPGHDSYVSQKYNGSATCDIAHRIAMIQLATQYSDWLDVDPWAGLYMPAELNFTDVMTRLEEYINKRWLDQEVKVAYVFGSDNYGFANAFRDKYAVCIWRQGFHDGLKTIQQNPELHHVMTSSEPSPDYSSRMAREGSLEMLDPRVQEYYTSLDVRHDEKQTYLIRCDCNTSTALFRTDENSEELDDAIETFERRLKYHLQSVFKAAKINMDFKFLKLDEQIAWAIEQVDGRNTLSLDAHFPGTANLGSSRVFEMAGFQTSPLYRKSRVGLPPLMEQIKTIPAGDYVLVEDDIATGGTIAFVKNNLPEGVTISDQVILMDYADADTVYDVVDVRDFLIGCAQGGLGVELSNGFVARAPYLLPFVNLRTRARVPAEYEKDFALMMWQANLEFYSRVNVTVGQTDQAFQTLAKYLGYGLDANLVDFCQDHIRKLLNSLEN